MHLRKASRLVAFSVAAVFAQMAHAQIQGHAVMPVVPGKLGSHAWVALATNPKAVIGAPGQPSSNCSPGTNDCYYLPADLVKAYTTAFIANGNGGSGITVGIVDTFYNSQTEADLAEFNSLYGLPACTTASGCLTIVNSSGVNCTTSPSSCTASPTFDSEGWALETDLDLEAVHSLAPNAHILLVTADSDENDDLFTAVQYASLNSNVVTSSWGGDEFSGEDTSVGSPYFSGSPVPLLWSSGDTGATLSYPCTSVYALCVGGTRLITTATDARNVESAWGGADTSGGAGGGCSVDVSAPSFQSGYSTAACGTARGVPDVSALADEYTGLLTYLGSFAALGLNEGCTQTLCPAGQYVVGGTSLASPLTAGVIANIDADRAFNSKTLLGANLNALIYQAAASYHYRFYDVTTGNTGFAAGTGWDRASGLGVILGPAMATYLLTQ
jgi:subtilase family serine protease